MLILGYIFVLADICDNGVIVCTISPHTHTYMYSWLHCPLDCPLNLVLYCHIHVFLNNLHLASESGILPKHILKSVFYLIIYIIYRIKHYQKGEIIRSIRYDKGYGKMKNFIKSY